MQNTIDHCRADIRNSARLTLSKEELPTIIAEIVDPFYRRVVADHETAGLIADDSFLFRLKIRQSVFLIRFFSQPLETLGAQMGRAGEVHRHIRLDFGIFARYYLFYADLVLSWLVRNREADQAELVRWQAKLFTLFGAIACAYGGAQAETRSVAALPPVDAARLVDLNRIGNMHAPDAQKISAEAFLNESGGIDWELVNELAELERDAQAEIDRAAALDAKLLAALEKLFSAFASVLNGTYEFRELGYALESLSSLLRSADTAAIDADRQKRLRIFLEAIVKDLEQWRGEIFIKKSALDIHYLDASLFSSCAQMETILLPGHPAAGKEEEFELF